MPCAVPCAGRAVVARRVIHGSWRPPTESLRWLVALPAAMVSDAAQVLAWPLRPARPKGKFRTIDIHAPGDSASGSGRRAAVAFLLSSTPGTYVVAADEEQGTVLVHALGGPSAL